MISRRLDRFIKEKTGSRCLSTSPVGGGCINHAFRIHLENGNALFVKQNLASLSDMFYKEAAGLELLRSFSNGIRIPEVLGVVEESTENQAFLVLEYIEEGRPAGDFAGNFGRLLAMLHRNHTPDFGLHQDNYIGKLPQKNSWRKSWPAFFLECRLEPQFRMAVERRYFSASLIPVFEKMCSRLDNRFPEEPASLIHGDLWGGNYLCDAHNRPVLIDPAVYYGHREAELSFTRLFGGFGAEFYRAYQRESPLQPGFEERMDLYNLYPLLVHVNLFGGSYVSQARHIIERY